ncbi:hypothetical protein AK830_g4060 [Neonectria ditissima]|uniref:Xylanolytic transcriptional activator regulatory domain-containing protein n=1 Tax=Neonectria ditissima TaxID=78410 RepID=A0A0P7BNX6_9HYPO|nr:hypothetical protein AK830_g4060 [Neonectria ditissima]
MDGKHQDAAQSGNSEQQLGSAEQPEEVVHGLPMNEPVGRMHFSGSQTSYLSDEHWAAVLDDIAEVKEFFEQHEASEVHSEANSTSSIGPELLFSSFEPPTQEDILSSMPHRLIVDRLISRYFNSEDGASVIIHTPTFQKEYDRFWEDPAATPVIWVGALYSIMATATIFSLHSVQGIPEAVNEKRNTALLYKHRVVQCLRLSDYTRPVPYTLETLIAYFSLEYSLNREAQLGIWLVFGVIIRLALRMGYHRDPGHYPEISAFDGEMRRRVWATLLPLDILTSGQIGLPWMIKLSLVDTQSPRNLLDGDFNEETSILPSARPSSELTPVSYTIIKGRLAAVLGQISDLTSAARPIRYEDVRDMDRLLLATHSSMPPGLQMRPIQSSIMDSPSLIMKRFNLDLLHQKARCILHRKFMVLAWADSQYHESRQACVKAALQILQHQNAIHSETQSGGLLEAGKWMVSSLTTHDFLLAAMILCLDLDHRRQTRGQCDDRQQMTDAGFLETQENELLGALETSRKIWNASSHSSEALKAFQVLGIMLGKLGSNTTFLENQAHGITQTSEVIDQQPISQSAPFHLEQDIPARFEPGNYLTGSPERDIEGLMDLEGGVDWNCEYG